MPSSVLAGALLVFALRVCDVSIGTVRTLYTVRGRRGIAATLGAIEAFIFITAVGGVLAGEASWAKTVAYAAGFAGGTLLGITLEAWIGSGWVVARIFSRTATSDLIDTLRGDDFGVTLVNAHGRDGKVPILFVVSPRRRGKRLLAHVRRLDARAFVTIDPIHHAIGGHLPGNAARRTPVPTGGSPIRLMPDGLRIAPDGALIANEQGRLFPYFGHIADAPYPSPSCCVGRKSA